MVLRKPAQKQKIQDAKESPFDPTGSDLVSTNEEDAIKEINTKVLGSASFGPTWGKGGSAGPGEYLYNENVESNKAGRYVPFDGTITKLYVNNRKNSGTMRLQLRRRRPCQTGSWTTLQTFTLTSGAYCDTFNTTISVQDGDELAIRIASSSADFEDPIVGIVVKNN